MMTSSYANIFSVTGPLWREFTGDRSQRPVTRSFDVFFDLRLNKRLDKQSRRRWFGTPSRSLWCHFNILAPAWWLFVPLHLQLHPMLIQFAAWTSDFVKWTSNSKQTTGSWTGTLNSKNGYPKKWTSDGVTCIYRPFWLVLFSIS